MEIAEIRLLASDIPKDEDDIVLNRGGGSGFILWSHVRLITFAIYIYFNLVYGVRYGGVTSVSDCGCEGMKRK